MLSCSCKLCLPMCYFLAFLNSASSQGGKLPRGVMLQGPPGTGMNLLAALSWCAPTHTQSLYTCIRKYFVYVQVCVINARILPPVLVCYHPLPPCICAHLQAPLCCVALNVFASFLLWCLLVNSTRYFPCFLCLTHVEKGLNSVVLWNRVTVTVLADFWYRIWVPRKSVSHFPL